MRTPLRDILGATLPPCPCGVRHEIPLREAVIGRDALSAVPEVVARQAPGAEPLLLLADPDTHDAAGASVASLLRADGATVIEHVTHREPHADDATIEALDGAMRGVARGLVAVGAGTIGDLGKTLAERRGIPLVTVGTAASMNGYASTIAALTLGGLKATVSVHSPRAVILDTRVLVGAPPRMTAAGFGDLMSKPVSGADWVLSGLVTNERVCPTALAIADDAVRNARARAADIGRGDVDALAVLAEALVVSGLSMVVAGASSPASGGEHLLSHYLDMSESGWQRPARLHGEQVAVGTLASLAIYRALRAGGPPQPAGVIPVDEPESVLRAMHAHLAPAALEAVLGESRLKANAAPSRAERRAAMTRRWSEIWTALDAQLLAARGLEEDLRAAGAPTRAADIGVAPERVRRLVLGARHMRKRYTVLDFAFDLGELEAIADAIASSL